MFKNKKNKKETVTEEVTKVMSDVAGASWKDAVCPAALEFLKDIIYLGDSYMKIYAILDYPPSVTPGYLRFLTKMKNVIVSYQSVKGNPIELKKSVDKTIREERMKQEEAIQRGRDTDYQNAQDKIDKALILSQEMLSNNAAVTNVSIFIAVYAETQEELKKYCQDVESQLLGRSFRARTFPYLSKELYSALMPINKNAFKENVGLDMVSSAYTAGLHQSPNLGLNEQSGKFVGFDSAGNPVFLDLWSKSSGKTNMNLAVMGKSGSGKSATSKDLILHELSHDTKVIIIDAEEEYTAISDKMGGNIIYSAGEKNSRINPLQLRDFPDELSSLSEAEINSLIAERKLKGSMSTQITYLKGWFKLYIPDLSQSHIAVLEESLYQTYAKFNITEASDPRKMLNEDFPVMADLYDVINENLASGKLSNEKMQLSEQLKIYLDSAVNGADSYIFNGHTNVDLNNQLVVFNVARLIQAPDNIKNAQFSNITSFAWLAMTKNRNEKVVLFIDEAHLFINENSKETFEFIGQVCKRARKYKAGLWVATQNIGDFLHPSVARYGEGILNNCSSKLIMKSDATDLQKLAALFNLNDGEQALVERAPIGAGLMIIGDVRIYAAISIERNTLKLCSMGGGA